MERRHARKEEDLPGEFLGNQTPSPNADTVTDYAKELRQCMQNLCPAVVKRHGEKKPFIFKDLATTEQVFIRNDGVKKPLQNPYDGPFQVIDLNDKTFTVNVRGREVKVSIDRVKPAYVLSKKFAKNVSDDTDKPNRNATSPTTQQPQTDEYQLVPATRITTKSGRKVHFPDRYQATFS